MPEIKNGQPIRIDDLSEVLSVYLAINVGLTSRGEPMCNTCGAIAKRKKGNHFKDVSHAKGCSAIKAVEIAKILDEL